MRMQVACQLALFPISLLRASACMWTARRLAPKQHSLQEQTQELLSIRPPSPLPLMHLLLRSTQAWRGFASGLLAGPSLLLAGRKARFTSLAIYVLLRGLALLIRWALGGFVCVCVRWTPSSCASALPALPWSHKVSEACVLSGQSQVRGGASRLPLKLPLPLLSLLWQSHLSAPPTLPALLWYV